MMAMFDSTTLFAYLRKAPFGGRLTQEQIEGVNAILACWERATKGSNPDLRRLAYVLATTFHETGGRMAPVREGFAKSDAAARKILANRPYALVDPKTGAAYYGRGFVQLTWAANYKTVGQKLQIDLYNDPDLALEPATAARILVYGMLTGLFTGKKLMEFFSLEKDDPVGARAIVNGKDKAQLIAGYHASILSALHAAETATAQPADVVAKDAEADAPSLTKDKTMWGTITSVIGAGGAGILGAIDNPWAVLALAIVGLGVILFLTGRLEIRRKAGA